MVNTYRIVHGDMRRCERRESRCIRHQACLAAAAFPLWRFCGKGTGTRIGQVSALELAFILDKGHTFGFADTNSYVGTGEVRREAMQRNGHAQLCITVQAQDAAALRGINSATIRECSLLCCTRSCSPDIKFKIITSRQEKVVEQKTHASLAIEQ